MRCTGTPRPPARHRLFTTIALTAVLGAAGSLAGCGFSDDVAEDTGSKAGASSIEDLPRTADMITLSKPAEGATVGDSFEAAGTANSFEGNVPWEVRDDTGRTVLDGHATADGSVDKLYPWKTTVDVSTLDPGDYVFVAQTDDPSDGEGKPVEEVGAPITVK